MKRNSKSIFFFWIVLGAAIVFAQVSQPVVAKNIKVEQSSTDEESSDEATFSISKDLAITSASGLSLSQEFYKIRDILLDEVADPHVIHLAQKLTETDHFKTLFRKVISANAP